MLLFLCRGAVDHAVKGVRPGAVLKGHPAVITMALCGDSGVSMEPCSLLKCCSGT